MTTKKPLKAPEAWLRRSASDLATPRSTYLTMDTARNRIRVAAAEPLGARTSNVNAVILVRATDASVASRGEQTFCPLDRMGYGPT